MSVSRGTRLSSRPTWVLGVAFTLLLTVAWQLCPAEVFAQEGPSQAFWPEVSPDGREVLFLSPGRAGPIHVMNADGSDPHRIAAGTRPMWFPDAKRIVAVARSRVAERIVVMNADGSDPDTLPMMYRRYVWRPKVSPDGKSIVIGNYAPDGEERGFHAVFHVVGLDGSPIRDIHPSAAGEAVEATWSHDGRLAFVSFSRDAAEVLTSTTLYVMNGDGTGEHAVATLAGAAQWISWSPDDRHVAMQQDDLERKNGNIVVVDVVMGTVHTITHHARHYFDETPSWSPDGHIYFQSNRDGAYAIYRMNADGSHQERLSPKGHGAGR